MNSISVAYNIRRNLSAIPEGEVFNYGTFSIKTDKEKAIAKELSRLVQKGEIVRIEKGKYYKPRQTKFGTLRPAESEIVKTLTIKGNKQVGYVTGNTLYNRLGLTTQVSNVIVIARNTRLPEKEVNGYRVKFVTRSIKFTGKDVPLLQLLDAIRDIKDIPDASVEKSLSVLVSKLFSLKTDELKKLVKLATQYNPATKALVGAIIEYYFTDIDVTELWKSLNPLTKYKIGISVSILPTIPKWNIE
jgi:predicted transcriptional regulator of viral defense system